MFLLSRGSKKTHTPPGKSDPKSLKAMGTGGVCLTKSAKEQRLNLTAILGRESEEGICYLWCQNPTQPVTSCCNRTRDNGFKPKKGQFRLDIRKKVFYNEGNEAQVDQRRCGCGFLEVFQARLEGALNNLV